MGDEFHLMGQFQGAILNIKSRLFNVTQIIGTIPHGDQAAKDELQQLIEQLSETLQQAPEDQAENAEAVAGFAEDLVEEVAKDKPNRPRIQITAEGLKKAAENVASVLPTVLPIAIKIAEAVTKLVG